MTTNNMRSLVCKTAKRLTQESNVEGATPNMFMKDAWAMIRKLQETKVQKTFFNVEYKTMKGSTKTIVFAESKEKAEKMFNDLDDEFGPRHEIISTTKPRKIPQGFLITVDRNGTYMAGTVTEEIATNGTVEKFTLNIQGTLKEFTMDEFISAVKAPKNKAMF